jgi:lipid A ethanolaminephosphotransferase
MFQKHSADKAWHPTALLAVLAAWLATAGNLPLWLNIGRLPETVGWSGAATLGALMVVLFAVTLVVLALIAWPRWLKAVGLLLLLVSTSASYFMHAYGVVIDSTMLANAANTDAREVRDLLTWPMLGAFAAGVVLPGWWWLRQPVRRVGWARSLASHLALAVGGVALAAIMLWLSFQDLASLMRNHKPLRYMINPFNSAYAVVRHTVGTAAQAQKPLQPIGLDAKLARAPAHPDNAPLVVVVVGETARAANFGLGGYERDTTPRLRELQKTGQLAYFPQVTSCGTNTQVSVPCMFSHLSRVEKDSDEGRYENVLDVIQRAGLAVLWVDNQSGCKGVCDRVPNVGTRALSVPDLCPDDECYDEVMLRELPAQLAKLDPNKRAQGTVVVLHQMGSHGPAYYKRSPAAIKAFQPECASQALQNCEPSQIVNAYDNSIRYTDHFLAETIAWLGAQKRPTALLYVSDHGESLGEKGLYLHGMPYSMAPEQQTHVPMVMWLSQAWQRQQGESMACVRTQAEQPWSHDNLFHTLLGLAGVSTALRQPGMDILSACQGAKVGQSS